MLASEPRLALTLAELPPLPRPDDKVQHREERRGVLVVIGGVSMCVGLTHGIALTLADELSSSAWWLIVVLIYAEAVLALISIAWLLHKDPGCVPRTDANCFPLPEAVASRIRKGQTLMGLHNITEGDATFCTRCLVWRRALDGRSRRRGHHHCSVCQRCVRDFDHHCGVFGRCIAGTATSGNLPPFVLLILTGAAGWLTTLAALAAALGTKYGGGVASGVVVSLIVLPGAVWLLYAIVYKWCYGHCAAGTLLLWQGRRIRANQATTSGLSEAFDLFAARGSGANAAAPDACPPAHDARGDKARCASAGLAVADAAGNLAGEMDPEETKGARLNISALAEDIEAPPQPLRVAC
mmetsp:Transcript_25937/g.83788  ORF Transcript_25937/g.83788 Transcript_25937/m.83788 type:complete len:353 (-) Transcript_25937:51-1109(-)